MAKTRFATEIRIHDPAGGFQIRFDLRNQGIQSWIQNWAMVEIDDAMTASAVVPESQFAVLHQQRYQGTVAIAQRFRFWADQRAEGGTELADPGECVVKTRLFPGVLPFHREMLKRTTTAFVGENARRSPCIGRRLERFQATGQPHSPLALLDLDLGLFPWKQFGDSDNPAIPACESASLLVQVFTQNRDDEARIWRVLDRCHCNGVTPHGTQP